MGFRRASWEVDVDQEGSGFLDTLHSLRRCRICLEEEDDDEEHGEVERSSEAMESPCACSGTLKFAHRGCIQRWCDEKRNTVCEICLQSFRPGYTVTCNTAIADVGVAIRRELDVQGQESHELLASTLNASSWDEESNEPTSQSFPASASGWTARCSQSIAMTFTTVLLVRNLISVVSLAAQYNALTLLVLFGLRATGVLLPIVLILKSITAIQNLQSKYRRQPRSLHTNEAFLPELEVDRTANAHHHVIQVNG